MDLTPFTGNAASWEVELFGNVELSTFVNTFYADVSLQAIPEPIPEPSSIVALGGLFGMGLIGAWWRRRRKAA